MRPRARLTGKHQGQTAKPETPEAHAAGHAHPAHQRPAAAQHSRATVSNGQKARDSRSAQSPRSVPRKARSRFRIVLPCGVGPCTLAIRAGQSASHGGNVSRARISSKVGTRADDRELIAIDQNFGDQRAGVVFRRHHGAISARRPEGDKRTRIQRRHGAGLGECITRFADRPDNIDRALVGGGLRFQHSGTIS